MHLFSINYHLRALQNIRQLVPFSTADTLACSLILSRLDYCNAMLYGGSARAINRLTTACTQLCCVCCHTDRPVHAITAAITVVTLVAGRATTGQQDGTNHVHQSHDHVDLSELLAARPTRLLAHCLPFPTSNPTSPDDPSASPHRLHGTAYQSIFSPVHRKRP